MASMYVGQLQGITLYGYLSIMGGALYMYPCLVSVYVDGVCCLYVLYVFHSFNFISFSRVAKASESAGEAERAQGQLRERTLQRERDRVWCVWG
jgi:hypothetical protein